MYSRYVYEVDGVLYWKARDCSPAWSGKWAGKQAGTITNTKKNKGKGSYVVVAIQGKKIMAHRIIWSLHYGDICDSQKVDHINGDGTDNRINNLRLVSAKENQQNLKRRADNTTGVTGVHPYKLNGKTKYRARITVDGAEKHLGIFETVGEAAKVRRQYEQRCGFHPNHGRSA